MEEIFDSGIARIGLGGDRRDFDCEAVRGLLAETRKAVVMQFNEWCFEFQQSDP
jgi:hypothetical protein